MRFGAAGSAVVSDALAVVLSHSTQRVKNMYERDGRQSPVSAIWGLWVLAAVIGDIAYVKGKRLNDFGWQGSAPG